MDNYSIAKLSLSGEAIKKLLIAIVVIAFFSFSDFSIYVYVIKVAATIGLLCISRYIKNDLYLRWIIIFTVWCLASFIWAIDKHIVILYLVWYLQAVILAYAIGTSVKETCDIEFVLKCIMFGSFILSIRSIQGVPLSALGSFRLGGNLGYNENEFALKVSLGCIIAYRYFFETNKRIKKIFYALMALFPLIAVLFSGSRKGIVMVFGAIFLYTILCAANPLKMMLNTGMAVGGGFLVFYFMSNNAFFYNSFGRRFLLLLNIFEEGAYVGNSIGNRMIAVQLGIDAFKRSPVIGFGLGNYIAATGLGGYAHNNYIQLLVDTGVVGIVIYYLFYVRNILGLIVTIKWNRGLSAILLSMVMVILVIEYGLVSFNSDYVQLIIMLSYYMVRINKEVGMEQKQHRITNELEN